MISTPQVSNRSERVRRGVVVNEFGFFSIEHFWSFSVRYNFCFGSTVERGREIDTAIIIEGQKFDIIEKVFGIQQGGFYIQIPIRKRCGGMQQTCLCTSYASL